MAGNARALEQERAKAQIDHNRAVDKLTRLCNVAAPNQRAVQNALTTAEHVFDKLQDSHVAYVFKLNSTIDNPIHKGWMDHRNNEHEQAVEIAQVVLGHLEVIDDQNVPVQEAGPTLEDKIDNFNVASLRIVAQLAQLTIESNKDNITLDQYGALSASAKGVRQEMLGEFRANCRDIQASTEEVAERATAKTAHDAFFVTNLPLIETVLVKLDAKKPAAGGPVGGGAGAAPGAAGHAIHPDPGLNRLARAKAPNLPCPNFDGRVASYSRFKLKFQELVAKHYEEQAQIELLEKALPTAVLSSLSLVQKSIGDIWVQLDSMFEDPKVLVKETVAELHGLSYKKLKDGFMQKLCVTLQDTEKLLASAGQDGYLRHPREVAALEDLLPKHEAEEYLKRIKNYGNDPYEAFKQFCVERKAEYEAYLRFGTKVQNYDGDDKPDKDSDNKGSGKCDFCGFRGHDKVDCRKLKNIVCKNCDEKGHLARDCPEDKDKKKIGSKDDQSNFSTHHRPIDCKRCKKAGTFQNPCPGCSKSGPDLKHCLAHCSTFMQEGVNGKSQIVKRANACVVCLHSDHPTDKCYDKDKPSKKCGIDICEKHHHPMLHGSTELYVTSVNTVTMQVLDYPSTENQQDSYSNWLSMEVADKKPDKAVGFKTYLTTWEKVRREKEISEIKDLLKLPPGHGGKVLLVMQSLPVTYGMDGKTRNLTGFFDDGSTCSLVENKMAEELKLWGEPVTVTIGTINGPATRNTKLYVVELLTTNNERKLIRAFGVETISSDVQYIELNGVKHGFSQEIQNRWEEVQDRPQGTVHLLIGAEEAGLHPTPLETRGNLIALESMFGKGIVLYGFHKELDICPMELSEEVSMIRQSKFHVRHGVNHLDISGVRLNQARDFMESESLGTEVPRRCASCKGCQTCNFPGWQMSEKEAQEFNMCERNVQYNEATGKFHIKYPFTEDPMKLSNNFGQVAGIGSKEEDKLEKEGLTVEANEKFQEFLDLGTLREIPQLEMDSWEGPVHYVSIQHVYKPSSETTRLRLVVNSSLSCPKTGLSLNAIMCKGPNTLGDMWEMLIRFCGYDQALIADITKCYHSMVTGLVEMHTRRVVWRWGKKGAPWKVFGFLVVTFGDRCAAVFLFIITRMTIQMFGNIDLVAAHKLSRDLFVDDLISGGTRQEVAKMKGQEDTITLKCDGTIPQILGKGGLKLKAMLSSGEPDEVKLAKLGGAVLGIAWSAENDVFKYTFVVNVSKRKRGRPTGENLTPETLHMFDPSLLSRRICLSVCNGISDIMGHITPVTIRLKVAVKRLFSPEYGLKWDDFIPAAELDVWETIIKMLVNSPTLEFPRYVYLSGEDDNFMLVVFFDGSDAAFSCAIYVVKVRQNDVNHVRLLTSKSKVAPDWDVNTVRMELNGAVLCSRITLRATRALHIKPTQIWFIGDSETVLASREKSSGYFKEWYSNRIGETFDNQRMIEGMSRVGENGEWWHVRSALNAADRPSRLDSTPEHIQKNSEWQTGPDFLYSDPNCWPIERNFAERKKQESITIPKSEINQKFRQIEEIPGESINFIQLESIVRMHEINAIAKSKEIVIHAAPGDPGNRIEEYLKYGEITNSWDRLIRITSQFFRWETKTFDKEIAKAEAHNKAVNFWMKAAMGATWIAYNNKQLQSLSLYVHKDMLVVTGRAEAGMKHHYGASYLPVLMSHTRTAYLVMLWAHESQHKGRDITLSLSYQLAWIVGGRKLSGKICSMCIRCRFLAKKMEGQKMASLPQQITVPCPMFTHIGLDLIGPIVVKKIGEKATRAKLGTYKIWVVLILCLSTKALKLYLACGYSTQDFLLAYQEFVSDHGTPASIHSDRGSQLVSAAGEMDSPDYDWDDIEAATPKSQWNFCPAGSQWRNGAPEAFVKQFKLLFKAIYGDAKLNQAELNAAVKRIASIVNSRPVSAKYGPNGGVDPDFLCQVTPNMMLTGRSNNDIPLRDYEDTDLPLNRLQYVTEIEAAWWMQFKVQNFSSLVPTLKWKEEKRNMVVGDVVLIQYSSKSKSGDFRMGRVVVAEKDPKDNLVRTVIVRYSLLQNVPVQDRGKYTGTITKKFVRVGIQRLCLILPKEEQIDIPSITEAEVKEALEKVEEKVQVTGLKVEIAKQRANSSPIVRMLKNRAEFDVMFSRAMSAKMEKCLEKTCVFSSK